MSAWPLVALGDVLCKTTEWTTLDPDTLYREVTVRLWGKGAVLRREAVGAEIGASRRAVVHAGEFLLSRIDARNGAFGIVPPELDGAIVSNDFPSYAINPARADPAFIGLLAKTADFADSCRSVSEGSTNRVRLQESRFLALRIPLPPLAEQRRIVARVEALAARIAEARDLRKQAAEEAEALVQAALNAVLHPRPNWTGQPLSALIDTVCGQVDPSVEPYASLPHISGAVMESGTCRLLPYRTAEEDQVSSGNYLFPAGSVLYSKIRPYLRKAVEVPVAGVCSADVYAINKVSADLTPRFLMYSLVGADFTTYANRLSGRTRMPKINLEQLKAYVMPYPSLPDQRRIVEYLDGLQAKVDAVKALQAQTAAELDALLPSILQKAFSGGL
jgi:type I restriction enzyme S subunit